MSEGTTMKKGDVNQLCRQTWGEQKHLRCVKMEKEGRLGLGSTLLPHRQLNGPFQKGDFRNEGRGRNVVLLLMLAKGNWEFLDSQTHVEKRKGNWPSDGKRRGGGGV